MTTFDEIEKMVCKRYNLVANTQDEQDTIDMTVKNVIEDEYTWFTDDSNGKVIYCKNGEEV
jgi:hypothetical protein